MAEWVWSEVLADAVRQFGGEEPRLDTEEVVLAVFATEPGRVLVAISEVAEQKRQGRARSGWAILKARLEKPAPDRSVTADDGAERDRTVQRALGWIERTGLHFDREEELLDELFGRGISASMTKPISLTLWDTPELRAEMLEAWRKVRPTGALLDREAKERGKAFIASQDPNSVSAVRLEEETAQTISDEVRTQLRKMGVRT